ncbi:A/G-specific DNA-adenine glycosylase [Hasllibacter halocynthiae]|uniref:Adenine DNA glycosylase n=1 Tax=Hasllibacter halocynthiae TaxID=595589 RepID=A0A2T0X1J2_9RHOB|nr:A/G-specific adenine glycosylase [Hasllibacter halocynthiae]PRY92800.1 A/G-specific DNA-adenine glycosylase [Hasllibacter halocynthiae]
MCQEVREALLGWYDGHARDLPWRIGPAARARGVRPEPYPVWLSEVMLQQTTVAAVIPYWRRFTETWPTVEALAAAEDGAVMAAWAGLGYYARARNLLACAREVAMRDGRFPETEAELRELPGIGRYTAAAIAAICFDEPAVVVDGNVERVTSRLFAVRTPLPGARPLLREKAASLTTPVRPGDWAQAVMDLGATICTPRSPACAICPVMRWCEARKAGIQSDLPAKAPKKARPLKRAVFWAARRADGAWLLERRPPKGMLGGTLGWPTTNWAEKPEGGPPLAAEWREAGTVDHGFTHYLLSAEVRAAEVGVDAVPERGEWHQAVPSELPTLFRKAMERAAAALD